MQSRSNSIALSNYMNQCILQVSDGQSVWYQSNALTNLGHKKCLVLGLLLLGIKILHEFYHFPSILVNVIQPRNIKKNLNYNPDFNIVFMVVKSLQRTIVIIVSNYEIFKVKCVVGSICHTFFSVHSNQVKFHRRIITQAIF